MIHRTPEDRQGSPLIKLIEPIHLSVIKDRTYLGFDVYSVTDINLLTKWLESSSQGGLDLTDNFKTRQLRELYAAIWIQLNILSPKTLLKFNDINEYTEKVH